MLLNGSGNCRDFDKMIRQAKLSPSVCWLIYHKLFNRLSQSRTEKIGGLITQTA